MKWIFFVFMLALVAFDVILMMMIYYTCKLSVFVYKDSKPKEDRKALADILEERDVFSDI